MIEINENKDFEELDILNFLSNTVLNYSHIPENYYFKLEMEILDISHNESLKNMNKQKSIFLIGMFVIFRILISEILFDPKSWYENEENLTEKAKKLLKQLGCYFLETFQICVWEKIHQEYLYKKNIYHKEMEDLLNHSGDDGFGNFKEPPELFYRSKSFLIYNCR